MEPVAVGHNRFPPLPWGGIYIQLAWCSITLRPTRKHLKNHVKNKHPKVFKGNEDKHADFWIYVEPYTGTPYGNEADEGMDSSSEEEPLEPPLKRPKVDQA